MYTTIYEDVNGTEWFQYDWKPNHEYIVFTIAAYKGIELDSCVSLRSLKAFRRSTVAI